MDGEVPWPVERKENTISRYAWLKDLWPRRGGKRAEKTEQRIDTAASEAGRRRESDDLRRTYEEGKGRESGVVRLSAMIPTARLTDR